MEDSRGDGATDPLVMVVDLMRAAAVVGRRVDRPLSAHGISLVDLSLLLSLEYAPGYRLRRVDLAERMGMSASSVTRLVAPLEKIGLIRRESDPRDRRASIAELTEAGRRVVAEARVSGRDAAEDVLRGWPQGQQRSLAEALVRLTAGLPSIARHPAG